MPRKKQETKQQRPTPKVWVARPRKRPHQLRYVDPVTGKEVRVSTGTRDEVETELQRKKLEAQLVLGLGPTKKTAAIVGPKMKWDDFREQYRTVQLVTLDNMSAVHAESRMDIAERILKPRTLGDIANSESLHKLQAHLLAGVEGKFKRKRSPHTVRSYMAAVLAAVNWAYFQGWISEMPKFRRMKVAKFKAMKGRPITEGEFKRMLAAVEHVVGPTATPAWKYVLRGLWESAFRLDELMNMSWDDPHKIRLEWPEGRHGIIHIPHALQKNDTEEDIPLLPGFEVLLEETPQEQRVGPIFNPPPPKPRAGVGARLQLDRVGKIISKIGKEAGIIVDHGDPSTGRGPKYASAHDLRRSCGQRMEDAGVPPTLIARVMRHQSWDTTRKHYVPGDVQKDAAKLKSILKPGDTQERAEGPPTKEEPTSST